MVTALAADPSNPRVLYAGIKEIGPLFEIGVLRSGNAGATWSFSARGLPKGTVQDLAIHPAAPRTVYAAVGGAGVFRSVDGGGLWKNVSRGLTNPLVTALAVGPAPGTLYAAARQGTAATGSLFRTTNGGMRWQRVDRGLPFDLQEVAVDPRGVVLYAGSRAEGVFRSTNSGAIWGIADRGLRAVATDAVVADPRRPAILYAGTPDFGLIKSVNGGVSWNARAPARAPASRWRSIPASRPRSMPAAATGSCCEAGTAAGAGRRSTPCRSNPWSTASMASSSTRMTRPSSTPSALARSTAAPTAAPPGRGS